MTHASHVIAGTALALAALAFPASAEILAMVNYETKSADLLTVLKSPIAPPARKEGMAIIDVDPNSTLWTSALRARILLRRMRPDYPARRFTSTAGSTSWRRRQR